MTIANKTSSWFVVYLSETIQVYCPACHYKVISEEMGGRIDYHTLVCPNCGFREY